MPEAVSNPAARALLSQLVPGQSHLLIARNAQNGNTGTPSVELSNTLTGQ